MLVFLEDDNPLLANAYRAKVNVYAAKRERYWIEINASWRDQAASDTQNKTGTQMRDRHKDKDKAGGMQGWCGFRRGLEG